jgi:hypothetical protein
MSVEGVTRRNDDVRFVTMHWSGEISELLVGRSCSRCEQDRTGLVEPVKGRMDARAAIGRRLHQNGSSRSPLEPAAGQEDLCGARVQRMAGSFDGLLGRRRFEGDEDGKCFVHWGASTTS